MRAIPDQCVEACGFPCGSFHTAHSPSFCSTPPCWQPPVYRRKTPQTNTKNGPFRPTCTQEPGFVRVTLVTLGSVTNQWPDASALPPCRGNRLSQPRHPGYTGQSKSLGPWFAICLSTLCTPPQCLMQGRGSDSAFPLLFQNFPICKRVAIRQELYFQTGANGGDLWIQPAHP